MRITTLCLSLALLLALACPARARWTNDPYHGMAPVCAERGEQKWPEIGRLEGSGYTIFFWVDFRDFAAVRTYYQVLDENGDPLLEENGRPLIEGETWWTFIAAVVRDGEGGVIAIFQDLRSNYQDVYGQRFDCLGNPLWESTGRPLAVWPGDANIWPDNVRYDSEGNIFIGCRVGTIYTFGDIYFQKVNRDGQRLWGDYGVPVCTDPSDLHYPYLVPDGAGGVMAVWGDERNSPNFPHPYFQHVNAEGRPLVAINGMPVLTLSGQMMDGFVSLGVPDGSGGGIWVFGDWWGTQQNLFRLNGAGTTLWDITNSLLCGRALTRLIRHPLDGSIWLSNGEDRYQPWGDYKWVLYRFDVAGNWLFGERGLPYGGSGANLVPTQDGVIDFAFQTVAGVGTRLYAQRVDSAGALIWCSIVALGGLTPSGENVFVPQKACSDDQDGAIVAFYDYRPPASETAQDLYAQRVHAGGRLGSPISSSSLAEDKRQILQVCPDQVQFVLPQAGQITLELFDLLGRRVATLAQAYQPAGYFTAQYNHLSLPSGIYLVRLQAGGEVAVGKVAILK
ncbi:MAG TPA: T9SS type A sorting domain-containing protein [bacterium]